MFWFLRCLATIIAMASLLITPANSASTAWLSRVNDIAQGGDGSVWLSLPDRDWISFIKPGGCMYALNISRDGGRPDRLLRTADGAMWFTLPKSLEVGYLRDNRIHYLSVKAEHETPSTLVQSRDGSVWVIPSYGTRILRIQNNAILNSVTVSDVQVPINEGALLPDGRLALIVGPAVKVIDLSAEHIVRTTTLGSVPARLRVFGDSIFSLEPAKSRIDVIDAGGRLRFVDLSGYIAPQALSPAALLVTDSQMMVGTAGGVYAFSKSGNDVSRLSMSTSAVVSVLAEVAGKVWYGSYDGDVGYIDSGKSTPVNLRQRYLGSALNCGSFVPPEWLQ